MPDDALPTDIAHLAREIHHELHRLHRKLLIAVEAAVLHNAPIEGIELVAALDSLRALEPRLDALLAAVPNDIATAVQAQKDADAAAIKTAQDALAAAQADAASKETALQAEADTLTAKVAALETALGIQPVALTVSPTSLTGPAGTAISGSLSIGGGKAPYQVALDPAAAAPPADASIDSTGAYSIGAANAETGAFNILVTDANNVSQPFSVAITVTAVAPPPVLTVNPSPITAQAGVASTQAVSFTAGTPPFSASGLPAGVTFDPVSGNLAFDDTTVAGTTTATFSDSSTPPLSASADITISA